MNNTLLIEFWKTNPNLWFNSIETTDEIIYEKFKDYKIDTSNKVEVIIWYDQIMRHFCRVQETEYLLSYLIISVQASLELLSSFVEKDMTEIFSKLDDVKIDLIENYVSKLTSLTIETDDFSTWFAGYPEEIAVFCLMPWKHLNTKKGLITIKEITLQLYIIDSSPVFLRFWKAIVEKLTSKVGVKRSTSIPQSFIVDDKCFTYDEGYPVNMKLETRLQFSSIKRMENIPNQSKYKRIKNVIVSFSGGVDSTTVLSIFKNSRINVVAAVYIQHYNAVLDDILVERELIQYLCNMFKCPLYIRDVIELTRDTLLEEREFYEVITRKIRYNAYREVADIMKVDLVTTPVVIAHHKGDLSENIIRNVERSIYWENLNGMEEFRTVYGITFWRPFLSCYKYEFYLYCIMWNLPHVKNSTPEWSQRGIIRNSVLNPYTDYIQIKRGCEDKYEFALRFYDSVKTKYRLENVLTNIVDNFNDLYDAIYDFVDNKIEINYEESKVIIKGVLYKRNTVFLNIFNNRLSEEYKLKPKVIKNIITNERQNKFTINSNKSIELEKKEDVWFITIIVSS
jgi:tRNA(Ile)-lysidine synthase TilS/MesJ